MNLVINLCLGIFLLACNNTQEKIESQKRKAFSKPEHVIWSSLLQQHVNDDGNVDYAEFKKNEARLDEYLNHLSQNSPATTWSKNEKLAYYINLYNAATVKLILVNHPIESIRDIPNRWKKKWIQVGSITTSLNAIEHEILRKMNEPRIHFAINCASYSCPKLFNVAFTQENMEQLLTKATKDFLSDPKRNRFENGKAKLSKIFKWYKSDFTTEKSLLEYINPYLEHSIDKNTSIEYLDYDWSLNESK